MRDKRDPGRAAKPEVPAVIEELLRSGEVKSAHYTGYAHEPILRLLHRYLGTKVGVMDYWDRYGSEACFWYDPEEDGPTAPVNRRPDWLEGVRFYVEGYRRDADLFIVDVAWHRGDAGWVLGNRSRKNPKYVVLTDEAVLSAGHRRYTWTHRPRYTLGVRKPDGLVRAGTGEGDYLPRGG